MTEAWKTRYDMGYDHKMILEGTEATTKAVEENTKAIKEAERSLLKRIYHIGWIMIILTVALIIVTL